MTLVYHFKPNWDNVLFSEFIHPEKHENRMTTIVRDYQTKKKLLFKIQPTEGITPIYDLSKKLQRIIVPLTTSDIEVFIKQLHTKHMGQADCRYTVSLYNHTLHVDMPVVHHFDTAMAFRQTTDTSPILCSIKADTDLDISLTHYHFVVEHIFHQ